MKEALFYNKESDSSVSCFLCPHHCHIADGGIGICGVRANRGGTLYSLNYAKVISANIDPIEKKPLFHFFPGSSAYSIASVGCNFKCDFCQNWQISQVSEAKRLGVEGVEVSPEKIVADAKENDCKSISYTYTEPTIFFEFAYDCAKLAKSKGLYNNFVTNGYISKEALEHISGYLDAANVDLKSFRDDFYRTVCKGSLEPVLDTIRLMKKLDIWVEVTTLVVPGQNDSSGELSDIAGFISSVDKDIPWHISRFHPDYKSTTPSATPLSKLEEAYQIGKDKGLKYIYIGNIYTQRGENTYCPFCNELVIKRIGFSVEAINIKESRCDYCGSEIAGRGL